jgi:hypothetical protein
MTDDKLQMTDMERPIAQFVMSHVSSVICHLGFASGESRLGMIRALGPAVWRK